MCDHIINTKGTYILNYAIVPKTTIMQAIENQAKKIASEQLAEISHHMNLENQGITDQKILDLQVEEFETRELA